jgi:hypothetical protein
MGICTDKSTNFLKNLGYNVVRVPREGISPLGLVGRQNGVSANLGPLGDMFIQPTPTVPTVEAGLETAEINGEESSKLDLSVGINVLGTLIGAMGGNLGVTTKYTNARKISFVYQAVVSDKVDPLKISQFIEQAQFNPGGPLMHQYVLGNGRLFVISETIKSTEFTVKYERSEGVEASVEVPVIEQLIGANISVSASGASSGSVTFKGTKPLVFGFRCLELGVLEGKLRLTLSRPEPFPLSASASAPKQDEFAILTDADSAMLELVDV